VVEKPEAYHPSCEAPPILLCDCGSPSYHPASNRGDVFHAEKGVFLLFNTICPERTPETNHASHHLVSSVKASQLKATIKKKKKKKTCQRSKQAKQFYTISI
jgi:hypothetical protein